jgi:nitrate reductase NapAB chaperone NapD
MAVCSYLVIPDTRTPARALAGRLAGVPGCEVTPAENREVLVLVTETETAEEERALRARLEAVEGVAALVFTFGEIDPDAPPAQVFTGGRREGS